MIGTEAPDKPFDVMMWEHFLTSAPYTSDAKPPFYIGDITIRDGTERFKSWGETRVDANNIMSWDGREWISIEDAMKRVYKV